MADLANCTVMVVDDNLFMPCGVAFRNGDLYVAEVNRILKYTNIESRLSSPPEPVVVSDAYPSDKWHGWKFIRFGPDGKLYVPVGAWALKGISTAKAPNSLSATCS